MENKEIIAFFDSLAPLWDSEDQPERDTIEKILDFGGIFSGKDVLDVACGTGVLFDYYHKRKVASVTAVDISPEMVKIAKEKYPWVKVYCADAESFYSEKKFDAVMIHNAFPHFVNPRLVVQNLTSLMKEGGRFSVAHSISREILNCHHEKRACKVSSVLPDEKELAEMLGEFFDVDIVISNEKMYQVSGIKK